MPIYEYAPRSEEHCPFCKSGFEQLQKITDAALEQCPKCNADVTRQISAPNVQKGDSDLSPSNIEKHGFTQYKKVGKGEYEKTAGKGPRTLSDKAK